MNIIETRNLKKEYRTGNIVQQVLKGFDLDIEEGQSVSITGKSGTGKSTILHQLSLLDDPTSGSIKILGKDVSDFNYRQKIKFRLNNFGFVFQDYALLPELTASENVAIPLISKGVSFKEAFAKSEKVIESLGLKGFEKRLPGQLSGGEKQRISIARAIVHDPKIIFADEPTANLDTKNSEIVIGILLGLQKEGHTIIMVTHELEYAKLADRLLVILDGVIQKDIKKKK